MSVSSLKKAFNLILLHQFQIHTVFIIYGNHFQKLLQATMVHLAECHQLTQSLVKMAAEPWSTFLFPVTLSARYAMC